MSTTSPSLKNFIEPVPLCLQTAALESLRSIFSSSNCDRVAVVNEQQQPLGLVYLRSLWACGEARTNDGQQPLSESPIAIEPVRALPAALSVNEFWQYLQTEELNTPARPNRSWAGRPSKTPARPPAGSGKFLGILDSLSLLQFAALNKIGRESCR